MFRKILIANRGEIACRVATTARRLGVASVAVHSDADAGARHVQLCDESISLGGLAAKDSYLRWERILDAARATGAEAIHPGYGFLSENEDFARACAEAGLVFIGPPPAAIAAMGSKSAAKALMQQAGVPLVPGYHGDDNDPDFLLGQAERIGFPVLIKASAGGGGRGMRRVERADEFKAALASCQREAQASFGSAHVLVERYVTRPRHIEIQVFADAHGGCIHLGERDCSVQRRHQKVLEESPAPGLSAARRAEMGAAAVAAARAVGYVGAGTVEFIAEPTDDGDLRFHFMEMNTRLQVEHPVTEAVTGFDLVEWQLRIASGEPLPVTQEQVTLRGHAIEARICAEQPDAGFLPAIGRLGVLRWPQPHATFERNPGQTGGTPSTVRVDAGVVEGDAISPHYDSMIAKLIVWGEDRAQALARLDAALRDTHIAGLHTNVAFLRRVAASAAFSGADLDTALIERERAALFDQPGLPLELGAAGVVAHALAQEAAGEGTDPWSRRDGWRLHGGARRRFDLLAHGAGSTHHVATLERRHGSSPDSGLRLAISTPEPGQKSGQKAAQAASPGQPLRTRALGGDRFEVILGERREVLSVYALGEQRVVHGRDGVLVLEDHDPIAHAADGAGSGGRLTAPMPGKIVALLAEPGQQVEAGQPLLVLEAMKMEHTITAPKRGLLKAYRFAAGDQVGDGAELVQFEAEHHD